MLFFVPASKCFDFDLADEMVQLNAKLMKDFNVGMVETHQIPPADLDRFLNLGMARQIYGDPRKSYREVEHNRTLLPPFRPIIPIGLSPPVFMWPFMPLILF